MGAQSGNSNFYQSTCQLKLHTGITDADHVGSLKRVADQYLLIVLVSLLIDFRIVLKDLEPELTDQLFNIGNTFI